MTKCAAMGRMLMNRRTVSATYTYFVNFVIRLNIYIKPIVGP